MATSNRERVGQMFDVLSPALDAFISGVVGSSLTADTDWSDLIKLKDIKHGKELRSYSTSDPQMQLRMLTENITGQVKQGWYPFRDYLGRVQESYASELREARNKWAHGEKFTDDDAYRTLDTAERLLQAIGAGDAADQVAAIRLNLRRVSSEKADRRVAQSAISNPESDGLLPWREVLPPHEDVATGNFHAAEFAADLYKVSHGTDTSKDYADPVEFFNRTYLTHGLRTLITGAVQRLGGDDNAAPVINLQTNFGGGKTHSMLSLWHLANGQPASAFNQDLQELLDTAGYGSLPDRIHRVAIVGNHLATSGSVKPDGTQVNTIWGELAWQLGGAEAFAIVAQADADRTPPGKALHDLLAAYSPAVILIDEWVAYARSLVGRDDLAAGTFDDQFTFAQSLTEAAKGTPGVMLAISIPASESGDDSDIAIGNAEEVGGKNGLEALRRLQNVVRRVADQWRPASSDESYHIVRQRLFKTPDANALAAIKATSKRFVEFYRSNSGDFPSEVSHSTEYEARLRNTYPIHPEVFDRLYEDWSSLERFQRTRGVLRLMNAVIHALWVGEDASPLIMPGTIPIANPEVNAELTQYLQDSWKAVIDADVDGPNSEPARIDQAKPLFGQRSVTKRLARTVFFGSAPTVGSAQRGLQTQRVFLGTAMPGDVPGNFHSALSQLSDSATYFYSGAGRYWYDLQANISRRARDQAERLHREDVWVEIVNRLRSQAKSPGSFAGVHVCPEDNGDIPDRDEARLVVLHPRYTYDRKNDATEALPFAQNAVDQCGTAHRTNRNMVVFLAADADRMSELDIAVRDYLGWTDVIDKQAELDLTENQKNQALDRQRKADETIKSRILQTYTWALVPEGQPVVVKPIKVDNQASSLAERVSKRMGSDGTLNDKVACRTIRLQLDNEAAPLWEKGYVSADDLWALYATYPYMPRLKDREVLLNGLTVTPIDWHNEGFALAEGVDESGRFVGLVLPLDQPAFLKPIGSTLLVRPDVAEAQRASDAAQVPGSQVTNTTAEPLPAHATNVEEALHEDITRHKKKRFFASKELSSASYAKDFKNITEEVLAHLAADPSTQLHVRIEIEATREAGFEDSEVRTVAENARTLKFEQADFEEH